MTLLRIDDAARVAIVEYSGVVDRSDAQIGIPELRERSRGYSVIIDLTGVTAFKVTTEDIQIAAARADSEQRHRCAFIAPADIAFGLTRMSNCPPDLQQLPCFALLRLPASG